MQGNKIRGNLFVVSAPSGAGKTTLCQVLTRGMENIRHSTSYTTRTPRKGEVNDRDYTFISEEEFKGMAGRGEFAEWAVVHGNLYGTSRKRVLDMLEAGIDVILDIDVQGVKKIRDVFKQAVYIFILPPSLDALRQRLLGRMSNSEEEIRMRMETAIREISEYKNYDYVIINSVFEDALRELRSIVISRRVRTANIDPSWVKEIFFKEDV